MAAPTKSTESTVKVVSAAKSTTTTTTTTTDQETKTATITTTTTTTDKASSSWVEDNTAVRSPWVAMPSPDPVPVDGKKTFIFYKNPLFVLQKPFFSIICML